MLPPAEQSPAAVRQAALEWMIRHDRGLTEAERRDFARWCERSRWHVAEFERATAMWGDLGRIRAVPRFQAEADAAMQRAERRCRRRRAAWMGGAMLAAAAAVALAYLGLRPEMRVQETAPNYQVLAGAAHEVRLPDGSTVLLNGDSRIETSFTETERRVWLHRGEALFTVAKNPTRPFFVTAGPVTVRAVGTAFNVQLGAAAINVLVTEGRVRLDDSGKGDSLLPPTANAPAEDGEQLLQAGQRAIVNLAAEKTRPAVVTAMAPFEMEQALAWQSTRLVFRDTPLDEVISAFNRYNPHKLALGAPELRERKITGIFRADNVEGFVRLLEAGADVKAQTRGRVEIVLGPSR